MTEKTTAELIMSANALPNPKTTFMSATERELIILAKALATKLEKPFHDGTWKGITVVLDGGLVQDVVSLDDRLVGLIYDVIDYDTDGAEDITEIRQSDGSITDAFVNSGFIDPQTVEILFYENESESSESLT